MATRTIPKARRRMNTRAEPPVYRKLVNSMRFDPDQVPDTAFTGWDLDTTYPPTVGELIGALQPGQEEEVDSEDRQAGSDADAAGRGGTAVPGRPQDGDPMGGQREDHLTEDTGGTSPLSS